MSLRAKRGNLVLSESEESRFEIAELVPSETRNLVLQFASATPRNDKRRGSVTNHMNQYNIVAGYLSIC